MAEEGEPLMTAGLFYLALGPLSDPPSGMHTAARCPQFPLVSGLSSVMLARVLFVPDLLRASAALGVVLVKFSVACWGMLGLLLAARAGSAVDSTEVPTSEQLKYFETHIRPLLIEKCYKCHNDKKQNGELRLDSREGVLLGGESGPAVVVGHLEESLLLDAVNYRSFEMPPEGKLSEEQIGHLTQWVEMGAPWPAGETVAAALPSGRELTDEDRAYWAFQPVKRVEPPTIAGDSWSRTAVDHFILAKIREAQLEPAPEADRVTVARRLYLDLTGLPPTLPQMDAFLSSSSDKAYENLVDQLLASPAYGENMARFWLDLVRYAESDGYKQDTFRPTSWRYRDYVVQSFNADKPYDRFVMEQLAGDEIDPTNNDAIAATGYLRNGIYEYNQRDAFGQWKTILEDMTETTSDAFLGLGLGCAKCHDHKFDPLLQKDYYRLQAFLCNVSFQDEHPLTSPDNVVEYQSQLAKWEEATKSIREKLTALEAPKLKELEKAAVSPFQEDFQKIYYKPAAERTPYEEQIAHLVYLQVLEKYPELDKKFKKDSPERAEWEGLKKELATFDSQKPAPLPTTLTVTDVGPLAPVVHVPDRPKLGEVAPGFPTVIDPEPAVIPSISGNSLTTGRRTTLAKWIASPTNPLSTRVIVNRIWALHFGTGLVASTSDFGRLGEPPSHPELLDWLTSEFIANEWSLKSLHKTIVMSAVYRQASHNPHEPQMMESGMRTDPAARLLWRFPIRRLAAEQIRDSMLAVSGELDAKAGGPGSELDTNRRSVYLKSMRNTREPLLEAFDQPDRIVGTGSRNVTTSPTQSLLMINGDWTLVRAAKLAHRLEQEIAGGDDSLVRQAYRIAYARDPQEAEIERGQEFLQQARTRTASVAPTFKEMPVTKSAAIELSDSSPSLRPTFTATAWSDGDFSVGATVLLHSVFPDASVRTIASRWNANDQTPGWSLGVTSTKSRFQPRHLILQLVGRGADGKAKSEAIPSGIHLEFDRPYSVAVSVHLADSSTSGVRFAVRDLSKPDQPVQVTEVAHEVLAGVKTELPMVIGGRTGTEAHAWDGLLGDLRISRMVITKEALTAGDWLTATDLAHWTFDGPTPLVSATGQLTLEFASGKASANPVLVDFCHVLLNSNEFLYVD